MKYNSYADDPQVYQNVSQENISEIRKKIRQLHRCYQALDEQCQKMICWYVETPVHGHRGMI